MRSDATDDEIETALGNAPVERWDQLWAAVEDLEAEDEHMWWGGGEQVDTHVVDGVERPVFQMPYAIYSSAVRRVVTALNDLGAIVPFNWPEWEGAKQYQDGVGLDAAPVAEAVRMATAIVRADRFVEGGLGASLDDGTFLAALRRLRQWYESTVGQQPNA